MVGLVEADAAAVRDLMARGWLGQISADARLGDVTLHAHQTDAVGRLRGIMREFGGAMLCDAVGMGKTYVALAIARQFERPCVIAPASLRDMWRTASSAAQVPVAFVSTESLSTRDPRNCAPDLVVVDESHRFRNRATARYSRLVTLTRDALVLLLSATPIHNRRDDLLALLELFLGSAAPGLPESEMARIVVRRDAVDLSGGSSMPAVHVPVRIQVGDDRDRLTGILKLPPPLPPADGSPAPALATITLLRLWASSDAALRAGLGARLARAAALRAALESGKRPTEAELRSWVYPDGVVQLGFAELLCSTQLADTAGLMKALLAHESAIRALYDGTTSGPTLDAARVAALREIRARHPDAKIVAFTQFAGTAAAFYRAMKACGRVGMLTGSGGRIASGRISRRETIERFAPIANEVPPAPQSAAIDFLLTTDVLSEGVNLQDSSVVVHLDLPWTATALEQRVGRIARLGSRHRDVFVYALDPPASAEALLRAESIIRAKSGIAADAVGASRIPALFTPDVVVSPSVVEEHEQIRRILASWTSDTHRGISPTRPACACVAGDVDGFAALVSIDGRMELIAGAGSGASTDPRVVCRVLSSAGGPSADYSPGEVAEAVRQIAAWYEAEDARRDAGVASGTNDPLRRALFARLSAVARAVPRHQQRLYMNRLIALRDRLAGRLSAGVELDLKALAADRASAEKWLARAEMILPTIDRSSACNHRRLSIRAILVITQLYV